MIFDVDVTRHGEVTVVAVMGDVDVATAPRLRQALVSAAAEAVAPPRVVVDISAVDFLDSTGLGVLLGGLKRVRTLDGELALVGAEDQVRRVFTVTRVVEILPLHDSLAAALETVRGG